MGYEIHITRKDHWFDPEGPKISRDEWDRYVAGDSELCPNSGGSAVLPDGSELAWVNEGTAVWTADHRPDTAVAPMHHDEAGNVHTKNPDVETIAKMHRIAVSLGARVQGDEGEFYGADGDPLPDDPSGIDKGASTKNSGFFARIFKGNP